MTPPSPRSVPRFAVCLWDFQSSEAIEPNPFARAAAIAAWRRAPDFVSVNDDDTHAHAPGGLHDFVKTPVVNLNGYGHISHDYVKVDGHWTTIRCRTTRMIVDELHVS